MALSHSKKKMNLNGTKMKNVIGTLKMNNGIGALKMKKIVKKMMMMMTPSHCLEIMDKHNPICQWIHLLQAGETN